MKDIKIYSHSNLHEKGVLQRWYACIGIFCLTIPLFLFISPSVNHAFDKKDIRFLSMIKEFKDNLALQFPSDVCTSEDGDIFILDSGLQKILIFDKDLLPVSIIDKTNGLIDPVSLTVDHNGLIFILEETRGEGNKRGIAVYDPLGRRKKTIRLEGFPDAKGFIACDIAVDHEGSLYLAGGSSGKLVILSNEGAFVKSIHPSDEDEQAAGGKTDVARVSIQGNLIYLLSEWRGHVYVYNQKGERVSVFGKKGGSPGKLSRPQGLTADLAEGFTYVMDYMRHTLLVYDQSGNFIQEVGGEGWGPGWFSYPKDICIDKDGRLFVADTFNKRVQVFSTRQ